MHPVCTEGDERSYLGSKVGRATLSHYRGLKSVKPQCTNLGSSVVMVRSDLRERCVAGGKARILTRIPHRIAAWLCLWTGRVLCD